MSVCVLKEETALHRELSVSAVISARSLWLRQRLQRAAGGETSLLYLSSCSCPLPLISLSSLLFLSSPQAVSYCAPLSIWSSVPGALPLQVCVYVPESQIKLLLIFGAGDHFKRRPTFLVVPIVIYYTIPFLLKAGNATLPFDGANSICICMCGLVSECVCCICLCV